MGEYILYHNHHSTKIKRHFPMGKICAMLCVANHDAKGWSASRDKAIHGSVQYYFLLGIIQAFAYGKIHAIHRQSAPFCSCRNIPMIVG